MARIYLSPSTQEYNYFVNGGTEEEYMNIIADGIVPYLHSNGILFTRNTPDMTAAESIAQANAGNYDLYFSLHSNAAPESQYGRVRGSLAYHYPNSRQGTRAARIVVNNAKVIYPLPNLVRSVAASTIGELARSRAPAVLWEVAYHDNVEDAEWIKANIQPIAWAAAQSIVDFFGLPLAPPQPAQQGRVTLTTGNLNIRNYPSTSGSIVARAANGATLTVLGQTGEWYVVRYGSITGYGAARYITIVT